LLSLSLGAPAWAAEPSAEPEATRFSRDGLIERAQRLSEGEFVEPALEPGSVLETLTYDQYRTIRFQTGASIWARQNRNFTIDLFHLGFLFKTPVQINLVVGGLSRRVRFTTDVFDYGPDVPAIENAEGLGYSGFRVRAPINRPDYLDEFLVFQGASYFRAVGRGENYGLSARGLAVRTARPEGEEFPVFTEFWIERPEPGAETLVVHALLESASVVGAYTFTARPGEETVVDVHSTLFPRTDVAAYGVAPLTSMFLFDPSDRSRFDDFRNAVHDSDGLQIVSGTGERIWRPLANPVNLQVSAFLDRNPRGFGLVQRRRSFEEFQDYEARYELRPSAWIEPIGEWGEGHVELVEIPSDREIHDNIVAYWQPAEPLLAGQRRDVAYRLRWGTNPVEDLSVARVAATRQGQVIDNPGLRTFAIDFEISAQAPQDLQVEVQTSAGEVLDPRGQVIAPNGLYRAAFELDPDGNDVIELRLVLTSGGNPWSETWLYRWSR
jgi:glucans biosynthesis protein